jgi:broad specificity phosphatase PhoE
LSETGEEQVLRVAEQLRADDRYPTVVKYSLAARCIDTANLIGRELRIGRNNLVPEFTFLDPRGLGGWDMTKYDTTYPAVLAFDNDQAGPDGLNARPISNEDGTPHETLSDVAIRLRQLMSILESQYSGETILLVFPDGTGPALLSAMVAGIPYNRVHELEFAPGELRVDVTKQSTLELWKQKRLENAEKYQSLLKQGRANLKNLQEGKGIKNLKDARIEAERIAIDKAYEEKERRRALALQREEELRLQRQKELRISSPDGDREIPPILLGTMAVTAAIGGIGLAAVNSRQGRRDNMSVVSDNTEKFTPNSNSTLGFGLNETLTPMLATVTVDNSEPLRVRSNMDGGSVGAREGGGGTLFSSNSFTRQRVNGDRNSLVPTVESPVMQDPKEAAKRAMEEYMNRDDGSSDWLMSLTEILQEEDDTDDDAASAIQDAMMQNSTKDEQTFQ